MLLLLHLSSHLTVLLRFKSTHFATVNQRNSPTGLIHSLSRHSSFFTRKPIIVWQSPDSHSLTPLFSKKLCDLPNVVKWLFQSDHMKSQAGYQQQTVNGKDLWYKSYATSAKHSTWQLSHMLATNQPLYPVSASRNKHRKQPIIRSAWQQQQGPSLGITSIIIHVFILCFQIMYFLSKVFFLRPLCKQFIRIKGFKMTRKKSSTTLR